MAWLDGVLGLSGRMPLGGDVGSGVSNEAGGIRNRAVYAKADGPFWDPAADVPRCSGKDGSRWIASRHQTGRVLPGSDDSENTRSRLNLPNDYFVIKWNNGLKNANFQISNLTINLQFDCCRAGLK